jgi:hypothetical protein
MADLGSIGQESVIAQRGPRSRVRCIRAGDDYLVLGGRENSEGNAAPCLRMDAPGSWSFWWPVDAGTIELTCDVRQAVNLSPRPRITIKANPDIGVNSDVTGEAPSGTGWVTIGPLEVSPTGTGALRVILEARHEGQDGVVPCYWDNIAEEYTA